MLAASGRKTAIAAAAALALVAGASAATAAVISSGPVDSSGVIHGCWSNAKLNGSRMLVLQDAGTSCPRGTTAISWSKGAPGIDGGRVALDGQDGACTVLHSFGPDVVTVSPAPLAAHPDVITNFHGCTFSGLPANADMQVTLVWATGDPPGLAAELFPNANGSTDVAFSLGAGFGQLDTEFNWIAVPSS